MILQGPSSRNATINIHNLVSGLDRTAQNR